MPILDPHSVEFISRGADQTRRLGMRLGALIQNGDVVCLVGDLGSGKTTFMQGIASGWGSLDTVTSPTFVIVNVYRGTDAGRLYHLDAYRLGSAVEAQELDLDVIMRNGPLVIEWAERIKAALPEERLWVNLQWIDKDQRDMLISASGRRYEKLLAAFRRQIYGVV
ncbi:MAG: tRNA (adenosine(37)-N6)-threonylcarbamoyltransferase complex ATPase subunit type 1 TsaE [Anaerolineales bacterium]|jgi:tRNA threonylcarbamoyladenosine biosynthesis protein TsaE